MLLMAVFIIPMLILTGAIKNKYADIYNPITKDNNDYGYMGIEFTKTRNIFEKT